MSLETLILKVYSLIKIITFNCKKQQKLTLEFLIYGDI